MSFYLSADVYLVFLFFSAVELFTDWKSGGFLYIIPIILCGSA